MHSGRYVSALAEAIRRRNLWMVLALLLAVSNLAQVLFLHTIEHRERVILVPPRFDREFWVRGTTVSDSYLEQYSVYMAELALSYSPDNVHYRIRQLLRYADPDAYDTLSGMLNADAERVERNRLSAVFHPQSVRLRSALHSAAVYGVQTRMVAGQVVDSRHTVVVVRFNGAEDWRLIHLVEIDPNEPDPFVAAAVTTTRG